LDILLKRKPEELCKLFAALNSRKDVAALLEIPDKVLIYHLYVAKKRSQQYRTFSVPKKSGGARQICAPTSAIKIIQQKLNMVLQNIYKKKAAVHGFIYGRSIVSNAWKHVRKEFVLNIDLLDFFPSITFPRVYGMFLGKPYRLSKEVATVLAQICCFDGHLPQGAPTSPIVSNMVCARLDGELERFARRSDCLYTRYADDITFSADRADFPEQVATVTRAPVSQGIEADVAPELEEIIKSNGFSINTRKVSIRGRDSRQQVTGLTVNEFPNVRRKYVNQIRAMLHAWEKYGLEAAEKEFLEKHDIKERGVFGASGGLREIVKGKINFFKMVRGPENPTYLKFCEQLSKLDPEFLPVFEHKIMALGKKRTFEDAVFVLESNETQGTAFVLEDVGVVTCAHVLGGNIFAFKASNPNEHYKVDIAYKSDRLDIAVLSIERKCEQGLLRKGNTKELKIGDSIKLLGFPKYGFGQTLQVHPGVIVGMKRHFGRPRININAPVIEGNSGGPVLNERGQVIGIAVTGVDKVETFAECEYGVIPIDCVAELLAESSEEAE